MIEEEEFGNFLEVGIDKVPEAEREKVLEVGRENALVVGKEKVREKGGQFSGGKKDKTTEKEKVKIEIKRMLEIAARNKKFGVTCEICKVNSTIFQNILCILMKFTKGLNILKVRYKKLHKLKFHILKHHSKEISGKLESKVNDKKLYFSRRRILHVLSC